MNCKHGWTEEEVVDFVLGRLSSEKAAAFDKHVQTCSVCSAELANWKVIMEEPQQGPIVPSANVKRRLFKAVRKRRGVKKASFRRPVAIVASFCLLGLFMIGTGWFKSTPNLHTMNSHTSVPSLSGTSKIRYVPVSEHNVKGYVWMNGNTDELMLYLNGLKDIQGKDYQAWLVSSEKDANAGLLKVNHGMGRLYFQGPEMEDAKHIVVTVEPEGGSKVQTGPREVMIKLNR